MEFRPLRAFVEVVRQGGFSQAAKVVFATQSTVSKAVRQLEDEIGMPLLDRIGHRSILTAAGQAVYQRGVKLLADRDDLLLELDEIRGLRSGVLRLGLAPVGSNSLFAPLVAVYRQRHPGIDIRLVEQGSDELEARLRAGEIDFASALQPCADDFDWTPIRRDPLVALVPQDHPLGGRSTVRLEDLRETSFILFDSGFALHRMIVDASRRAGFDPDIVVCTSQIDFMVELAGAGLGVAFLPRRIAANRRHAGLRLLRLEEPGLEWFMSLAWRRGAYLSAAAQAWLDLVREIHPPQ